MTEHKNFTNQPTPRIVDKEYRFCNFTQTESVDVAGKKRGIRLFPGDDTTRTFINCNLTNCEPPPGSTLVKCNTTIVAWGIPTTQDVITVDGESVVLQHHSTFVYGRFDPVAWEYIDLPSPDEHEED